jgi:hypothetical protein
MWMESCRYVSIDNVLMGFALRTGDTWQRSEVLLPVHSPCVSIEAIVQIQLLCGMNSQMQTEADLSAFSSGAVLVNTSNHTHSFKSLMAGLCDADFLRTSITPVVKAELCKLCGPAAEAFFNRAVEAYKENRELIAQAPTEIEVESVEGLIIVHLTHAADNFSIKCASIEMHFRTVQTI